MALRETVKASAATWRRLRRAVHRWRRRGWPSVRAGKILFSLKASPFFLPSLPSPHLSPGGSVVLAVVSPSPWLRLAWLFRRSGADGWHGWRRFRSCYRAAAADRACVPSLSLSPSLPGGFLPLSSLSLSFLPSLRALRRSWRWCVALLRAWLLSVPGSSPAMAPAVWAVWLAPWLRSGGGLTAGNMHKKMLADLYSISFVILTKNRKWGCDIGGIPV